MKPLKLSTRLNPLGEAMKLENAFNKLRETDHRKSFDGLESWLDQNHKSPRPMKNIYKIAASFIVATLILIACSVPVEYDEEIGYMIKGNTALMSFDKETMKDKLTELGLDPSQVSLSAYMNEKDGQEPETGLEVVMILPEADMSLAEEQRVKLSNVFDFRSIDILPIEEKVERTAFEAAMKTLEIERPQTEAHKRKVAASINKFLKEHSSSEGEVEIRLTDNGKETIALIVDPNGNGMLELKQQDLEVESPRIKVRDKDGNVVIEMDAAELRHLEVQKKEQ